MPKPKKHKKYTSKFPGVRYYNHESRKHGVKYDRYYSIRYRIGGRRIEEALGWSSEGWTETKAAVRLNEIKENIRTGTGPQTLNEARELRQAELEAKEAEKRSRVTVSAFWKDAYFPKAKAGKKERSWKTEDGYFRMWIEPAIGSKVLQEVAPLDVERIKKRMLDAGRAPRTVEYVLAIVRQVFNTAEIHRLFSGTNPANTKQVKRPKKDNKRYRWLAPDEAERLLEELSFRSKNLHDIALLSLGTGCRAGEAFSLSWEHVDFKGRRVHYRDTKDGKSRFVPMPERVVEMLRSRRRRSGGRTGLVFPSRTGGERRAVSKSYSRAVEYLKLNEGVADERDKVVFHTLRHSFASWLVQKGEPLLTVGRLLGHSTITMMERYAHLAPKNLQGAVDHLDNMFSGKISKEQNPQKPQKTKSEGVDDVTEITEVTEDREPIPKEAKRIGSERF